MFFVRKASIDRSEINEWNGYLQSKYHFCGEHYVFKLANSELPTKSEVTLDVQIVSCDESLGKNHFLKDSGIHLDFPPENRPNIMNPDLEPSEQLELSKKAAYTLSQIYEWIPIEDYEITEKFAVDYKTEEDHEHDKQNRDRIHLNYEAVEEVVQFLERQKFNIYRVDFERWFISPEGSGGNGTYFKLTADTYDLTLVECLGLSLGKEELENKCAEEFQDMVQDFMKAEVGVDFQARPFPWLSSHEDLESADLDMIKEFIDLFIY